MNDNPQRTMEDSLSTRFLVQGGVSRKSDRPFQKTVGSCLERKRAEEKAHPVWENAGENVHKTRVIGSFGTSQSLPVRSILCGYSIRVARAGVSIDFCLGSTVPPTECGADEARYP